MEYIAYLHKDAKSDYGVSFPDFPGCISAGSTLEEAKQMAAEALSFHIAGMREDAEAIPEPSSLDQLRDDPAMKDAVAFLVQASEHDKTVRINITARESQIAEIDKLARAAKLTRSAYIVQRALASENTGIVTSKSASIAASMSVRTAPKKPQMKLDRLSRQH